MSLWDRLLAAWIYEELSDEDSAPDATLLATMIRRTIMMIPRRSIDVNSKCFQ